MPDYSKANLTARCHLLPTVGEIIADLSKASVLEVDTGVYRESAQHNIASARKALNEIEALIALGGEKP